MPKIRASVSKKKTSLAFPSLQSCLPPPSYPKTRLHNHLKVFAQALRSASEDLCTPIPFSAFKSEFKCHLPLSMYYIQRTVLQFLIIFYLRTLLSLQSLSQSQVFRVNGLQSVSLTAPNIHTRTHSCVHMDVHTHIQNLPGM